MMDYTNNSSNTSDINDINILINKHLLWLGTITSFLIALVIVLGNSLVLYAAQTGNMNVCRLRDHDGMIKSLALNDLLIGFVVIPFRMADPFELGKNLGIG